MKSLLFVGSLSMFAGGLVHAVTVALNQGWNLVSPVLATAQPVESFVQASGCSVSKVWEYNSGWSAYTPGAQNNQLQTIKPGQGYWFLVNSPCSLVTNDNTSGYRFSFPSSGWKLVGSNSQSSIGLDAAGLLNPANFSRAEDVSNLVKIWEYDPSGSGWRSWQAQSPAITTLRPGFGYWLFLSGGVTVDSSNASLADLLPPVCPGCPPIQ